MARADPRRRDPGRGEGHHPARVRRGAPAPARPAARGARSCATCCAGRPPRSPRRSTPPPRRSTPRCSAPTPRSTRQHLDRRRRRRRADRPPAAAARRVRRGLLAQGHRPDRQPADRRRRPGRCRRSPAGTPAPPPSATLIDTQCPGGSHDMPMLRTEANGQPAFGLYMRTPEGDFVPFHLQVLELDGDRVRARQRVLRRATCSRRFGLPDRLPPTHRRPGSIDDDALAGAVELLDRSLAYTRGRPWPGSAPTTSASPRPAAAGRSRCLLAHMDDGLDAYTEAATGSGVAGALDRRRPPVESIRAKACALLGWWLRPPARRGRGRRPATVGRDPAWRPPRWRSRVHGWDVHATLGRPTAGARRPRRAAARRRPPRWWPAGPRRACFAPPVTPPPGATGVRAAARPSWARELTGPRTANDFGVRSAAPGLRSLPSTHARRPRRRPGHPGRPGPGAGRADHRRPRPAARADVPSPRSIPSTLTLECRLARGEMDLARPRDGALLAGVRNPSAAEAARVAGAGGARRRHRPRRGGRRIRGRRRRYGRPGRAALAAGRGPEPDPARPPPGGRSGSRPTS